MSNQWAVLGLCIRFLLFLPFIFSGLIAQNVSLSNDASGELMLLNVSNEDALSKPSRASVSS